MNPRCLIIEDESDTARYIANGLADAGFAAVQSPDVPVGVELADGDEWDIIILDRMLPNGADGLSIVQSLRDRGNTTPVIIISALATLDERVRGLRGGGDDYLAKPFGFEELLARIQALLRRSSWREDGPELQVADLTLDLVLRRARRGDRPISLQPREFTLLEYLVRHRDQAVTRSMLLEAVWGYHFDPQTGVIDVQISRLRQKIDRGFSPQLIQTVRGVGYMVGLPV